MIVEKELLGFTAGNFDLLHPGYIKCFKWAKKHCDKFIIFPYITLSYSTLKWNAELQKTFSKLM